MKFEEAVSAPVLETLTAGIYDGNANCIREYVQNAGDSGSKIIEVSTRNGKDVVIRDYGTGMDESELFNALYLGKSSKSEEQSGWRGIGIYSGISNFRRIFINTKKEGQDKLHIEIDCEKMRALYTSGIPIGEILEKSISEEIEHIADAGFKPGTEVILNEVLPNQEYYFQNDEIRKYLIVNVPLPMKDSPLSGAVIDGLKERGINEPKNELLFNGDKLFRPPHNPELFLDHSLSFRDFIVEGKIVASAWVVFNKDNRELDEPVKGIVFKKKGFTIGDSNTVRRLYLGSYNFWSYGEIHILDPKIRENAGRNGFEINSGTAEQLFVLLREFLQKLQQGHRYKSKTDRHNNIEKAQNFLEEGDYRKAAEELKKAKRTMAGTQKAPEEKSLSKVNELLDKLSSDQKKEIEEIEKRINEKKEDEGERRANDIISKLPSKEAANVRKKLSDKSKTHELFEHPMKNLMDLIRKKADSSEIDPRKLMREAFYSSFSDDPSKIKDNAKILLIKPERIFEDLSNLQPRQRDYPYYITGGLGHAIYEFYNIFVNGEKHYGGGLLSAILEGQSKETKARAYADMYYLIEFLTLLVELSDKNGSSK